MRIASLSLIAALLTAPICQASPIEDAQPNPAYWELDQLTKIRGIIRGEELPANPVLEKYLARLRTHAEQALTRGPYSVMLKEEVPPSGNKHDYMSFSRYWWPDPEKPDGLPYVRHDGKVNKALRRRGDRDQIGMLSIDVEALTLAAYLFSEKKYAVHATKLIRTWFLNPETKMNPHMKFGQGVPGRAVGRGVGILDSRGFIRVLDSVALLSADGYFVPDDLEKLRKWFAEYLDWLRTSDLGKKEAAAENNHGSWYAAQTARIALFVGEAEIARNIVQQVQQQRLPDQFLKDGSQPAELKRTQSLHYSFFNLEALSVVARIGERLDIDLWKPPDSTQGLRPGIEFLMPYVLKKEEWPHPQIQEFSLSNGTVYLLRMASVRYDDTKYLEPIAKFPHRHPELDHAILLFRVKE